MNMKYAWTMPVALIVCLAVLTPATADDNSTNGFDMMNLVGKWEGEGMFLMPVTNIEVSISGEGNFTWDAEHQRIRTAMQGSKLFFNYSDSGYLQHFPATDSVSWEVWDSFGKHALYWGVMDNAILRADRRHKSKDYRVTVTFPHPDTLDFHLIVRPPDSDPFDKASFRLWRVSN